MDRYQWLHIKQSWLVLQSWVTELKWGFRTLGMGKIRLDSERTGLGHPLFYKLADIYFFLFQSMLDEGISREVINRIQKLRKKAKLLPSNEVS